ncbi:hypothetical protein OPKNFCMD_2138 [Methylobacterium crusticola]|uniref:BrnA antitoxin family protein n=1 Tax=Methylobacterium crusticola TaxID=1697972 RepID=A0ABQ4QVM1_9HYPH|nr:BrnA antitoxin family protein [Methylobacterium crusticola]GJD49408.1 hypothetical protein OPKNFCMD_2138 [Methylobacterium crusticola]
MTASRNDIEAAWTRLDAAPATPDDDSPELTEADFARGTWRIGGTPVGEAEGRAAAAAAARPRGRPPRSGGKQHLNLRVDHDVVAAYRATGPGWQGRMNDALRKAIGL